MKSTFFAILASAAVVLASPLPEADAHQGQAPSYAGGQGGGNWGQPQGGNWGPPQGQWPPAGGPPAHWGGGDPNAYAPVDPAPYFDPHSGGPGGVSGGFQGEFQGTFWTNQGLAPPQQWGYDSWDAPNIQWPQGSPFGNGNVNQVAGQCAQNGQVMGCCQAGDSSGLLGGILPGGCTLNLLDSKCNQEQRCCDTQTQNGLVNIGFQCGDLLGL